MRSITILDSNHQEFVLENLPEECAVESTLETNLSSGMIIVSHNDKCIGVFPGRFWYDNSLVFKSRPKKTWADE